jgi:hypothetical protein
VEENCLSNCVETQQAADAAGDACGDAYVVFQDCQTQRTCEQVEQRSGCEAEVELVMNACGGVASEACQAVCPKWIECGLEEAESCLGNCALMVGFARVIGPECATAFESIYLCEAELECAELGMDQCAEEQGLTERVCE